MMYPFMTLDDGTEIVHSETLEGEGGLDALQNMHAILVPGGFGKRGTEGKIRAIEYARTHKVPYLGICLGMQLAVVEFARHVAGMKDAHSTEFDEATQHPVIALITEWQDRDGSIATRSADSDLGGTMRLGGQVCHLAEDSRVRKIYGQSEIVERHRHRYEVNARLLDELQAKGLKIAGRAQGTELVEVIELPDHPWFVACQFHPEFTSNPRRGHPLFTAFVQAALAQRALCGEDAE